MYRYQVIDTGSREAPALIYYIVKELYSRVVMFFFIINLINLYWTSQRVPYNLDVIIENVRQRKSDSCMMAIV